MWIRSWQIDHLSAVMLDSFVQLVLDHIQQAFPKELSGYPEAALRTHVEELIAEGRQRGCTTELDLVSYVECRLPMGLTVEDGRVRRILDGPEPIGYKLRRLERLALAMRTR